MTRVCCWRKLRQATNEDVAGVLAVIALLEADGTPGQTRP